MRLRSSSKCGRLVFNGSLCTVILWLAGVGCGGPAIDTADASQASATAEETGDSSEEGRSGSAESPNAERATPQGGETGAGGGQRAAEFGRLRPPDPEQFPGLKLLSPEHDVWIDAEKKRVVLRGGVCLREGPLELFACIHQWADDEFAEGGKVRRGTKEYESVVTINAAAALVHTGLLAVGAEPGSPARFAPEYRAAHGTPIDVLLYWEDEDGKRREAKAQEWIRNAQTDKPMEHTWVFAGSGFRVNEQTGEKRYLGEDGNLICVSNFPDAVMDIPIESSADNASLLFEAFTERIPPIGTPVTIVLVPRPDP